MPFGLVLSNHYGWNAPFLMLAGLGVFVLAAGASALPPLRGHLYQQGHRHASPLAEVRAILVEPDHLRAFALVVSLMFGGFAVIPYISKYLELNVGVSKENLPLVYVAGGVLTLVSSPLIGRLGDRHGRFRVYRVIAPVAAVLMLVMTNLPRVPLALAVAAPAALMVGNSGRMVDRDDDGHLVRRAPAAGELHEPELVGAAPGVGPGRGGRRADHRRERRPGR